MIHLIYLNYITHTKITEGTNFINKIFKSFHSGLERVTAGTFWIWDVLWLGVLRLGMF